MLHKIYTYFISFYVINYKNKMCLFCYNNSLTNINNFYSTFCSCSLFKNYILYLIMLRVFKNVFNSNSISSLIASAVFAGIPEHVKI